MKKRPGFSFNRGTRVRSGLNGPNALVNGAVHPQPRFIGRLRK